MLKIPYSHSDKEKKPEVVALLETYIKRMKLQSCDDSQLRHVSTHSGELVVHPMPKDGNCLTRAIAECVHDDQAQHGFVRQGIFDYSRSLD